jgi:hypothetical protein
VLEEGEERLVDVELFGRYAFEVALTVPGFQFTGRLFS